MSKPMTDERAARIESFIGYAGPAVIRELLEERERLRAKAERLDLLALFLWALLDDIDTASDIAKGNDSFYRTRVEAIQKRRWKSGAECNGYIVDFRTCTIEKIREASRQNEADPDGPMHLNGGPPDDD